MAIISGRMIIAFTKEIDGEDNVDIMENAHAILDELMLKGVNVELVQDDGSCETLDADMWNIEVDGIVDTLDELAE
jgi:hypothetical protein